MRVHELAKELGVTSKELLVTLGAMGVTGKSASSSVPEDIVPRLRASGGKATTTPAKPREVLEPPPAPRKPKPKAKPKTKTKTEAAPVAPSLEAVPPVDEPAKTEETKQVKPRRRPIEEPAAPTGPVLQVIHGATPQTIGEKTNRSPAEIVMILFRAGEMVTATTSLGDEAIELIAAELGYTADIVGLEDELKAEEEAEVVDETKLETRAPVVTIMGHVDHGKTKLLDAIRSTDVVAGEFGGITQHIGAYQAHVGEREITFIDTPGHEAFTAMRARGASVTDIAVLVVAADDGVMPQTLEALDHAKAANVPIVVAVNKVDKEDADPNRVRTQMVEHGIIPAEWGGEFEFVDVSAKAHQNLDSLLETLLVVADLEDLKGDPTGRARGTVLEAHLDKGRGPVATVLVQRGTLRVGDSIVAGPAHGRVRALLDEHGESMDETFPAQPAMVLGLSAVPGAGQNFLVVEDDRVARQIAEKREARERAAMQAQRRVRRTLEDFMASMEKGESQELTLILKGDVSGSVEALEDSLAKIDVGDEVSLRVIDRGVGAITETNVDLAAASDAIIIGFNVRPQGKVTEMAEREGVEIRYYSVIYNAIEEIEAALKGMLKPEFEEQVLGQAEIRAIFRSSKIGTIAGCMVTSGVIRRNAKVRLIRDGNVVLESADLSSLKREKDDASEVREGFECGLVIKGYNDIKEGDVVEAFEMKEIPRG